MLDLQGKHEVEYLDGSVDALDVEEELLEKCDCLWLGPEDDIVLLGKLVHRGLDGADHGSSAVVQC